MDSTSSFLFNIPTKTLTQKHFSTSASFPLSQNALSQEASAATPLSPPISSRTSPIPASPATNQMTPATSRLNHRIKLRRHQQRRTNPAPPLAFFVPPPPASSATSQRRPSSTPEATRARPPVLRTRNKTNTFRMKSDCSWIY
ncbi:mucin-2-like [Capsicum annuum]|uniref:mucin-2-like n=1 Tax=Capsicum annuum TaxID=4072 RepID=UPI001FB0C5D5|nr:mucin-2-like [Capsicum annuum]